MPAKKTYEIDGASFSTLEEFAHHFSKVVLCDHVWRGNLNAFNDILRGGFGTPDGGFILVWHNSNISRESLGYQETIRKLELQLETCDPSNRESIKEELEQAKFQKGPTVFEWIVEIIKNHGPEGDESENGVELELK